MDESLHVKHPSRSGDWQAPLHCEEGSWQHSGFRRREHETARPLAHADHNAIFVKKSDADHERSKGSKKDWGPSFFHLCRPPTPTLPFDRSGHVVTENAVTSAILPSQGATACRRGVFPTIVRIIDLSFDKRRVPSGYRLSSRAGTDRLAAARRGAAEPKAACGRAPPTCAPTPRAATQPTCAVGRAEARYHKRVSLMRGARFERYRRPQRRARGRAASQPHRLHRGRRGPRRRTDRRAARARPMIALGPSSALSAFRSLAFAPPHPSRPADPSARSRPRAQAQPAPPPHPRPALPNRSQT